MYAIVRSGGKQVKVAPGDVVRLERTAGARVAKGDRVELSEVILVSGDGGTRTGQKAVSGVKVVATVLGPVRSRKVLIFKKKRTKQYRRTKGHRQNLVEVRIDGIEG
ncbi:MAG TPA: 50S ribosomal protein L21 [Thermoanaerobaculia bacterium]|jgi:large subunit ribosomal protein L21